MIKIKSAQDCCGCTACSAICPKGAITMKPNELGFLYPSVDTNLCINCNLCSKVCHFQNYKEIESDINYPLYYAVRHKEFSTLINSQSGGIFTALTDSILKMNGIIYGAGYSSNFEIIHKRANTIEQRNEFRGSKYVQSNLNNIFNLIKNDLENGSYVLFSGTPCQVAGLNNFIKPKLKEKLILVDIICHGVPSPQYWQDYLICMKNKIGEFHSVNFRDKVAYGWDTTNGSFTLTNGKKVKAPYKFYNNILFRDSCYKCPYASIKRPSDITIGDYWKHERANINFNEDNKGCSLVICNSSKGQKLFEEIKSQIYFKKVTLEECSQPNLFSPCNKHPRHEIFIKSYKEKGFEYAMNKAQCWGIKAVIRKRIRKIINILKFKKEFR